jgi:hypothetical protein
MTSLSQRGSVGRMLDERYGGDGGSGGDTSEDDAKCEVGRSKRFSEEPVWRDRECRTKGRSR